MIEITIIFANNTIVGVIMTNNLINTNYYSQIAAPKSSTVNTTKSTSTDFSSLLQSAVNATDKKQTGESSSMSTIFDRAAAAFNVPVTLLKAVAKNESNFDADAVSSCGAQGVMQLMPSTAKSLGVTNSLDAEQNIMGGAKYLSQMLSRYDGDTTLALAAYNAGSGNVAKYGGVPPFKETQTYIARVLKDSGADITAPTTQLPSLTSILGSSLSSNFGSSDSSDFDSTLTSLLGASSSGSLSDLSNLSSSSGTNSLNGLDSLLNKISSLRGTTGAAATTAASDTTGKVEYTYDDYISFLQLYIAQMQASALQSDSSGSDSSQAMSSNLTGLTSSESLNSLV